eukprot:gene20558-biopygen924
MTAEESDGCPSSSCESMVTASKCVAILWSTSNGNGQFGDTKAPIRRLIGHANILKCRYTVLHIGLL